MLSYIIQEDVPDIAADNLWVIGTLSSPGYVVTFNSKLRNVPTEPLMWEPTGGPRPQVFYFEE